MDKTMKALLVIFAIINVYIFVLTTEIYNSGVEDYQPGDIPYYRIRSENLVLNLSKQRIFKRDLNGVKIQTSKISHALSMDDKYYQNLQERFEKLQLYEHPDFNLNSTDNNTKENKFQQDEDNSMNSEEGFHSAEVLKENHGGVKDKQKENFDDDVNLQELEEDYDDSLELYDEDYDHSYYNLPDQREKHREPAPKKSESNIYHSSYKIGFVSDNVTYLETEKESQNRRDMKPMLETDKRVEKLTREQDQNFRYLAEKTNDYISNINNIKNMETEDNYSWPDFDDNEDLESPKEVGVMEPREDYNGENLSNSFNNQDSIERSTNKTNDFISNINNITNMESEDSDSWSDFDDSTDTADLESSIEVGVGEPTEDGDFSGEILYNLLDNQNSSERSTNKTNDFISNTNNTKNIETEDNDSWSDFRDPEDYADLESSIEVGVMDPTEDGGYYGEILSNSFDNQDNSERSTEKPQSNNETSLKSHFEKMFTPRFANYGHQQTPYIPVLHPVPVTWSLKINKGKLSENKSDSDITKKRSTNRSDKIKTLNDISKFENEYDFYKKTYNKHIYADPFIFAGTTKGDLGISEKESATFNLHTKGDISRIVKNTAKTSQKDESRSIYADPSIFAGTTKEDFGISEKDSATFNLHTKGNISRIVKNPAKTSQKDESSFNEYNFDDFDNNVDYSGFRFFSSTTSKNHANKKWGSSENYNKILANALSASEEVHSQQNQTFSDHIENNDINTTATSSSFNSPNEKTNCYTWDCLSNEEYYSDDDFDDLYFTDNSFSKSNRTQETMWRDLEEQLRNKTDQSEFRQFIDKHFFATNFNNSNEKTECNNNACSSREELSFDGNSYSAENINVIDPYGESEESTFENVDNDYVPSIFEDPFKSFINQSEIIDIQASITVENNIDPDLEDIKNQHNYFNNYNNSTTITECSSFTCQEKVTIPDPNSKEVNESYSAYPQNLNETNAHDDFSANKVKPSAEKVSKPSFQFIFNSSNFNFSRHYNKANNNESFSKESSFIEIQPNRSKTSEKSSVNDNDLNLIDDFYFIDNFTEINSKIVNANIEHNNKRENFTGIEHCATEKCLKKELTFGEPTERAQAGFFNNFNETKAYQESEQVSNDNVSIIYPDSSWYENNTESHDYETTTDKAVSVDSTEKNLFDYGEVEFSDKSFFPNNNNSNTSGTNFNDDQIRDFITEKNMFNSENSADELNASNKRNQTTITECLSTNCLKIDSRLDDATKEEFTYVEDERDYTYKPISGDEDEQIIKVPVSRKNFSFLSFFRDLNKNYTSRYNYKMTAMEYWHYPDDYSNEHQTKNTSALFEAPHYRTDFAENSNETCTTEFSSNKLCQEQSHVGSKSNASELNFENSSQVFSTKTYSKESVKLGPMEKVSTVEQERHFSNIFENVNKSLEETDQNNIQLINELTTERSFNEGLKNKLNTTNNYLNYTLIEMEGHYENNIDDYNNNASSDHLHNNSNIIPDQDHVRSHTPASNSQQNKLNTSTTTENIDLFNSSSFQNFDEFNFDKTFASESVESNSVKKTSPTKIGGDSSDLSDENISNNYPASVFKGETDDLEPNFFIYSMETTTNMPYTRDHVYDVSNFDGEIDPLYSDKFNFYESYKHKYNFEDFIPSQSEEKYSNIEEDEDSNISIIEDKNDDYSEKTGPNDSLKNIFLTTQSNIINSDIIKATDDNFLAHMYRNHSEINDCSNKSCLKNILADGASVVSEANYNETYVNYQDNKESESTEKASLINEETDSKSDHTSSSDQTFDMEPEFEESIELSSLKKWLQNRNRGNMYDKYFWNGYSEGRSPSNLTNSNTISTYSGESKESNETESLEKNSTEYEGMDSQDSKFLADLKIVSTFKPYLEVTKELELSEKVGSGSGDSGFQEDFHESVRNVITKDEGSGFLSLNSKEKLNIAKSFLSNIEESGSGSLKGLNYHDFLFTTKKNKVVYELENVDHEDDTFDDFWNNIECDSVSCTQNKMENVSTQKKDTSPVESSVSEKSYEKDTNNYPFNEEFGHKEILMNDFTPSYKNIENPENNEIYAKIANNHTNNQQEENKNIGQCEKCDKAEGIENYEKKFTINTIEHTQNSTFAEKKESNFPHYTNMNNNNVSIWPKLDSSQNKSTINNTFFKFHKSDLVFDGDFNSSSVNFNNGSSIYRSPDSTLDYDDLINASQKTNHNSNSLGNSLRKRLKKISYRNRNAGYKFNDLQKIDENDESVKPVKELKSDFEQTSIRNEVTHSITSGAEYMQSSRSTTKTFSLPLRKKNLRNRINRRRNRKNEKNEQVNTKAKRGLKKIFKRLAWIDDLENNQNSEDEDEYRSFPTENNQEFNSNEHRSASGTAPTENIQNSEEFNSNEDRPCSMIPYCVQCKWKNLDDANRALFSHGTSQMPFKPLMLMAILKYFHNLVYYYL